MSSQHRSLPVMAQMTVNGVTASVFFLAIALAVSMKQENLSEGLKGLYHYPERIFAWLFLLGGVIFVTTFVRFIVYFAFRELAIEYQPNAKTSLVELFLGVGVVLGSFFSSLAIAHYLFLPLTLWPAENPLTAVVFGTLFVFCVSISTLLALFLGLRFFFEHRTIEE